MRVLVIGAGLAGLGAALALSDAGHRVTVLEARDQLGGRVLTYCWRGLAAELGGEWIDDGHAHMRALCARFDLTLHPDDARQCSLFRGRVVCDTLPEDDWARGLDGSGLGEPARDAIRRLIDVVERAAAMIPDPARPEDSPVAELDRHSIASWLEERGAPAEARAWLRLGVLSDYGTELEDVSLLQLARGHEATPPLTSARIVGGNDQLPAAMAGALRGEVYVGAPVEAIRARGGVTATVGRRVFDADAAVVAVPAASVLRIRFDPPLPPRQTQALRTLPYGHITKRLAPCVAAPWAAERPTWWFTDLDAQVFYEPTHRPSAPSAPSAPFAPFAQLALLTAYTAGARAATIDEETTLDDLERVFPGARAAWAGQTVVKRWGDDPYTRGAYAAFGPGYLTGLGPSLGQPHGQLVFAGEHVAPVYTGYMEGAVISGQAAASLLQGMASRMC